MVLEMVFFGIQRHRNPKKAEFVQAKAKSRRDDGLNPIKDDNFLGELNFDATFNLQNCVENKRLHPAIEGKKQENESESSTMVTYDKPPEHKVFINFHRADLRHSFIGHLVKGFKRDGVNVYIDVDEKMGEDLGNLFKRIEDSRYTESKWCLNELVKIKELMEESKLLVIPIFYKLEPLEVT